jgi:predicted GTPase
MSRSNFLTERLAELQAWRFGLIGQLDKVERFLETHDFNAPAIASRLADARRAVESQRITIAFVAEVARGKSELINALFFSNLGRRLLPSGPGRGTRCVTEVRFDREKKTGVRLLPVETRESPLSIEQLLADESQWRFVSFDADSADSTARALAALSETKRIGIADAVAWGLHASGVAAPAEQSSVAMVDVPRWRYAVINYPHPMLDAGLVIVDTPGIAAFSTEPELARQRVPSADAVILVLDVNEGASRADLALWRDYLGGAPAFGQKRPKVESDQTRMIVLNKIDEIRLHASPESEAPADIIKATMREIDRKVKETADTMRLDPIRVVAVSGRLGLAGKLEADNDKLVRSRLYQLERTLAASLPAHRQEMLTTGTVAALDHALETAQATLDNDRYDTLEGLRELTRLLAKNEKLGASLDSQTQQRQDRLEGALRELKSVRNVHVKLGTELAELADVAVARRDAARARTGVAASAAGGVAEVLAQFFDLVRERLDALEAKIEEVRNLHAGIADRLRGDFGIPVDEPHPFATQRFHTELQKIQEAAQADFMRSGNLLTRRGATLGEQFEQLIGSRAVHIFEIAARESASWMRGLYAALEKPLERFRDDTLERVENLEKLKSAEIDLAERVAALQARLDAIKRKHLALEEARRSLHRFAGTGEDRDAA